MGEISDAFSKVFSKSKRAMSILKEYSFFEILSRNEQEIKDIDIYENNSNTVISWTYNGKKEKLSLTKEFEEKYLAINFSFENNISGRAFYQRNRLDEYNFIALNEKYTKDNYKRIINYIFDNFISFSCIEEQDRQIVSSFYVEDCGKTEYEIEGLGILLLMEQNQIHFSDYTSVKKYYYNVTRAICRSNFNIDKFKEYLNLPVSGRESNIELNLTIGDNDMYIKDIEKKDYIQYDDEYSSHKRIIQINDDRFCKYRKNLLTVYQGNPRVEKIYEDLTSSKNSEMVIE